MAGERTGNTSPASTVHIGTRAEGTVHASDLAVVLALGQRSRTSSFSVMQLCPFPGSDFVDIASELNRGVGPHT
jgi:hypothetical protein